MARAALTADERIFAECHSMPLRLIHRVVSGCYDAALRPLGVRVAQLNVLVAIARMGDDATAARIGKYLVIDKSTLSRDLERMHAQGWIETSAAGRANELRLTTKGRRLLDRALPAWERAQAEIQALLGKESLRSIAAAAERIRESAES
jgi:DNA-binding MarR family transcriptional regulator